MSLRRLCQQGAALVQRHAASDLASTSTAFSRTFASLPEDIAEAARRARFPARRPGSSSWRAAAAAEEAAARAAALESAASVQQEGAKIATAWMFPWERRQLQGGALRPWEKFYWGVFVVAISLVLFNRLRDPPVPPDPAIKEAKEAAKAERARQVLAGASLVDGEDDPFEGMTPEEIQAFIAEVAAVPVHDPFEGMSPDEIVEHVRLHGLPSGLAS